MSDPTKIEEKSSTKCFGCQVKQFQHTSDALKCSMVFSVIIPPQAETEKVPIVYWLSGLTCTDKNFVDKAGAPRLAAHYGALVVCPDTSPRGCNIEGEDDSWDFGTGAGFYIDATEDKWKEHYNMFSYVTSELPRVVLQNFNGDEAQQSVMGHSMGGHGALVCALRSPGLYTSVSAFAPICNPINCPWGVKAFTGYLGDTDKSQWSKWDACELAATYDGPPLEILIDQGASDSFLTQLQLLPDNFVRASAQNQAVNVVLRKHEGYDHSYFFIASFLEDHLHHHVAAKDTAPTE